MITNKRESLVFLKGHYDCSKANSEKRNANGNHLQESKARYKYNDGLSLGVNSRHEERPNGLG